MGQSLEHLDKIKTILEEDPFPQYKLPHIIAGLLGIALLTAHTHQDEEARKAARAGFSTALAQHPRYQEILEIFRDYLEAK